MLTCVILHVWCKRYKGVACRRVIIAISQWRLSCQTWLRYVSPLPVTCVFYPTRFRFDVVRCMSWSNVTGAPSCLLHVFFFSFSTRMLSIHVHFALHAPSVSWAAHAVVKSCTITYGRGVRDSGAFCALRKVGFGVKVLRAV